MWDTDLEGENGMKTSLKILERLEKKNQSLLGSSMDRVTQLDLQECLTAATSTGERELSEVHLRVSRRN